MSTIHAIYEDGVFKPIAPVALPESCEVEFEPRIVESGDNGKVELGSKMEPGQDAELHSEGRSKVFEILDRRYNSGHTDTAERHNEHQP